MIVALVCGVAWISVAFMNVGPEASYPPSPYPWWYGPVAGAGFTSVLVAALSVLLVAFALLAIESPPAPPGLRYLTLAAAALPPAGCLWLVVLGLIGADQPTLSAAPILVFGGAGLYLLFGNLAGFPRMLGVAARWLGAGSGGLFVLAAASMVAGTPAVLTLAALASGFVLYMVWSVMVAMQIRRTSSVPKDRLAAQ